MKKKKNGNGKRYNTFVTENGTYKTLLSNKFLARKPYIPKDPKKLLSFIPGTINKIFVQEGDEIKINSKILILEAMKMKNVIISPIQGKVKTIYVKANDLVANKQLLVELE